MKTIERRASTRTTPRRWRLVVTDDVAVYDYGAGETHGKGDFQNGMAQLFSSFSDAKTATNRVWIKGNVVIAEVAWAGTMTGDVMGMKATQKPVGQMRVHIYWFNDDGLVKEVHEYARRRRAHGADAGQEGRAAPCPCSPTNPPEMHIAKGDAEADKPRDWAKSTDDAFNKDDAKAVAADDGGRRGLLAQLHGAARDEGQEGPDEGARGLVPSRSPTRSGPTTNAWGIDGFGIVEHTMTGTFKGPFGPVRADGQAGDGAGTGSTSCSRRRTGRSSTAGATRTSSR